MLLSQSSRLVRAVVEYPCCPLRCMRSWGRSPVRAKQPGQPLGRMFSFWNAVEIPSRLTRYAQRWFPAPPREPADPQVGARNLASSRATARDCAASRRRSPKRRSPIAAAGRATPRLPGLPRPLGRLARPPRLLEGTIAFAFAARNHRQLSHQTTSRVHQAARRHSPPAAYTQKLPTPSRESPCPPRNTQAQWGQSTLDSDLTNAGKRNRIPAGADLVAQQDKAQEQERCVSKKS